MTDDLSAEKSPADTRAADIAAVRAFWERLGLPGLIDVHTHFMPKQVLDKVWQYFDSAGPLTGRVWPIAYREDEDARMQRLRDFGILAFSSMLYPHKPDMAAWLNSWAAEFAARTPDCLHTATFYPEPGAGEYVAEAISHGARIFKSHVQVGNYSPDDPLLNPVWELLQEHQIPTVIHAGSGPAPGTFTGPAPVNDVLERHPELPLIIAHMGMPEYTEFLDMAERFPNVYLDTTMAFTTFTEAEIPFPPADRARLLTLQDRILHGSDFPNIPYPYIESLDALQRLDLGDDWLRAVCFDNAVRLFGIAV
ncbi:amidohydrolase family protein [Tomitella biformata]|uniref:amidohydrolase family protein n=1 Tax=Tomitella biformata TaxID=630403 RepID=UPI00046518EA|nr:amidohydrolase family protein [Tomitella biformata]